MSVFKHTMLSLDYAAKTWGDSEINFSLCMHDLGKRECYDLYGCAFGHESAGLPYINSFCDTWKIPNKFRSIALLVCEHHTRIHSCLGRGTNAAMRPKSLMKLFEATSATKKPERFEKILKACIADARGRGATPEQIAEFESRPYPQADYLRECLQAVIDLDTKSISKEMLDKGKSGVMIGESIRVARIDAIRTITNKWRNL